MKLDKEGTGRAETKEEIERINDPDVNLYAWFTDTGYEGRVGKAYIGGACDNTHYKKTSLSRGPGRGQDLKEAAVETAEVTYYNIVIIELIVILVNICYVISFSNILNNHTRP